MNRRSMILRGAAVIIAWFALLELGRYGMLRFQSAGSVWGVKLTAAAIFAGTGGILLGVRRWLCRHTEEFKGVQTAQGDCAYSVRHGACHAPREGDRDPLDRNRALLPSLV